MYFAYDPQKQICTAPNGPVGNDHGFVFTDLFFTRLFRKRIIFLSTVDHVKVIAVVVYSITTMVAGILLVSLVTVLDVDDKHSQQYLLKQQLILIGFEQ